jgi:tetratricopeptide (TPR) repeat protein
MLMLLADQLWQQGRLQDAAAAYEETTKVAARGASELSALADEFTRQDKPADAAIKRYQAGQASARTASAYARWARILALRGWNADVAAQGVNTARKAVDLDPKNAEARATLILAYDRAGQYDAAIEAGRQATELDKANADAFAFLAEAYADKLPLDPRAHAAADTAVKLNGDSVFAHRNLGYVLETEGDYREAAAEYMKAITLAPTLAPLFMDLGRVYYIKLEKLDEAVSALRRATELDPNNPQAHTELGRCYYTRGDFLNALASLQRAIAADPKYATAYGYLGWVYYFGLHQYEKAIPQFQKALELGRFSAGRTAEYYTELGWSLYFLGRCPEARPAFQRALDLLASQPDANIAAQAYNGLAACPAR